MTVRIIIPILLVLISAAVVSEGQELSKKQSLILEFRQLTGADRVNMSVNVSTDDVLQSLASMVEKDSELTDSQKKEMLIEARAAYARIDKIAKDFLADREELNKLSEAAILQLYDSTFTEAELMEVIAFYKTPTGRKTAQFLPRLSTGAQKGFIDLVLPRLQAVIESASKAETEKLKQKIADVKVKKS